MSRVVIDLTGPSVSTRTRSSKSGPNTSIDSKTTKAAKAHGAQHVNEATAKTPSSKKRKFSTGLLGKGQSSPTGPLKNEEEAGSPSKKAKKMSDSPEKDEHEEKRLRRFRERAPQSYLERLARANLQRMFIISRTPIGMDGFPQERIEIAGSTGNIYNVDIGLVPSCTCPDNKKGNQCKHIIYVLCRVLKAPSRLQYQLAFLSSELHEIFSRAPPAPTSSSDSSSPSNRKEVSGDCPICFTAFEPETEEIIWCRAACGNNVHKTCFEQWAKTKGIMGYVRCVFCRTLWQEDEDANRKIKTKGRVNEEGYVNVGDQLGLPAERDFSTYHQYGSWRQYRHFC